MNEEIPKKELKKAIYISLWVILGGLFGIVLAGLVEFMSYWITDTLDIEVVLYGVMIYIGLIFGLFVGPYAWKKIYIDGVRGKKYLK